MWTTAVLEGKGSSLYISLLTQLENNVKDAPYVFLVHLQTADWDLEETGSTSGKQEMSPLKISFATLTLK